jgi:hypothetical protein
LVSLHLSETAARPWPRVAAFASAVAAIYVGWLTKSDTFNLVMVLGVPAFAALKLRAWLFSTRPSLTFRSAFSDSK